MLQHVQHLQPWGTENPEEGKRRNTNKGVKGKERQEEGLAAEGQTHTQQEGKE